MEVVVMVVWITRSGQPRNQDQRYSRFHGIQNQDVQNHPDSREARKRKIEAKTKLYSVTIIFGHGRIQEEHTNCIASISSS